MRTLVMASIVSVGMIFVLSSTAWAQESPEGEAWPEVTPGPGWKTCPRCQNQDHVDAWQERLDVEGHPFDPNDLSGVWYNDDDQGIGGIFLDQEAMPAFTPYGEELWAATHTDNEGTNAKDPMLICDPLGYPRWFTYNYGYEFIHLPDRTLQFFAWGHAWRTIWTDGRDLPEDPPVPNWAGFAVGRWEGDEFVIESNGFDERSWLDQDRREGPYEMKRGLPHSGEMRIVERYRRTSYETLEITLTIIDPIVYIEPWTTRGLSYLRPGTELDEYHCVPSENAVYNSITHETYF